MTAWSPRFRVARVPIDGFEPSSGDPRTCPRRTTPEGTAAIPNHRGVDSGEPTPRRQKSGTRWLPGVFLAGHPMTVGDAAKLVARGSEIGVRRCLARLVDEGIVKSTEMGRNRVHELNREHLAAPVAELLAKLRPELFSRIRAELNKWRPKPYYACVFGSAARADGGTTSDIDLLLVHAPFPGDPKPPKQKRISDSLMQMFSTPPPVLASEAQAMAWPD
jgi:predicted nucleotidyltransferase